MRKNDDPITIQDTIKEEMNKDLINTLKKIKKYFAQKLTNK